MIVVLKNKNARNTAGVDFHHTISRLKQEDGVESLEKKECALVLKAFSPRNMFSLIVYTPTNLEKNTISPIYNSTRFSS